MRKNFNLRDPDYLARHYRKRIKQKRRARWLDDNTDWLLWLAGIIAVGVVLASLSDWGYRLGGWFLAGLGG